MSSRNRKQDTKVNDKLRSKTTESVSITIQDGDALAAVIGLIQNDDDIMKKILETVTQAIVKKLMDSPNFLEKLAKNVLKNGVLDNIKQDIYESCAVDNGHKKTRYEIWRGVLSTWNGPTRSYGMTVTHKSSTAVGTASCCTVSPRSRQTPTRQSCRCTMGNSACS